jgi:hypothetical protein
MTDIAVENVGYSGENRSWLLGPHGTEPGTTPSIVLDLSLFTVVDDVIPSGTVVGEVTVGGLYGPYDAGAADGTEVAAGILFNTIGVRAGQTQAATAMLVHGFVRRDKLTGIDAAGEADLKLIHFS